MASPKNMRREASLAIIRSVMRVLQWDREYRHYRAQQDAALQYLEIRKDVKHHREIKAELQTLGYKHARQRRPSHVWRDSRYVADFSPHFHQEDRPAEEPSAPTPGKGGPHPRAATAGDFMEVAKRSKAKPARPLHLKRSVPSSDVESALLGAPTRPGPSASSSSSLVQAFAAPQARLRRALQPQCCPRPSHAAESYGGRSCPDCSGRSSLLGQQRGNPRLGYGGHLGALTATAAWEAAAARERREAEAAAREAAAACEACAAQEAMAKKEAEVKALEHKRQR